jgi:hypothetical protein
MTSASVSERFIRCSIRDLLFINANLLFRANSSISAAAPVRHETMGERPREVLP